MIILKIAVFVLLMAFIISFIVLMFEVKKAPLIPGDQPFLYGDYDLKKDPVLDFERKYCTNCKYYDKESCCLHNSNVGKIKNENICKCIENGFFEPE